MTSPHPWTRIPAELRERPQWLVAGPSKAPLSIDSNGKTFNGSVTDPNTWRSFAVAAQYAHDHGLYIGYVISPDDPFCCVDLDWVDEESQKRKGKAVDPSKWAANLGRAGLFERIVMNLNSYTERSTNGRGLHVWVRADIGTGARRDDVEVYSQDRFMICTGDHLSGLSTVVEDRQMMITNMVIDMRTTTVARNKLEPLVELPDGEDEWDQLSMDAEIMRIASEADNGDKFNKLCTGQYEEFGFPSQSEADLALMSMFTFYSPINSQCRRLFRMTALGKREKAVKNDRYVNYTLQLIRHRQKFEGAPTEQDKANADALIAKLNVQAERAEEVPLSGADYTVQPKPVPVAVALTTLTTSPPQGNELPNPPGFAGAIAEFIFNSSPRPVREVAIVSALGLLAGICGKAWHIPQSGLNLYIVLVARSGVGKETMHSGISCILKACSDPVVSTFVSFSDFASGPALVKYCVDHNSFINVSGEWGRKLKRIAEDGGDGPIATLRTMMTNLYQKSGPQSILGGIEYSNQENKVESVSGVAYSMIGETTPDTFYQALTETMMEDGFLSRFTIIEYNGDRPMANKRQVLNPDPLLVQHLTGMASLAASINGTAGMLNNKRQSVLVGRTEAARDILDAFELECDENIRGSTDEGWRQMWNRGALKSMRIAALLGVADNPSFPVVDVQHAAWAVDVIRRDIAIMRKKIQEGDVGMGDHNRQRKLVSVVREYLTSVSTGYKVNPKMQGDRVIPLSYMSTRTARLAVFQKHKMGAAMSLTAAVREMVEQGYFHEIPTAKAQTDYGTRGKCYMVVDLPLADSKKG